MSPDAPMFVIGVNEKTYKPSDMVINIIITYSTSQTSDECMYTTINIQKKYYKR